MTKTILIVDDETRIRRVIARYLARERKYTLLEAADGRDALRVMDARPVDLVILDLMMPHLDGAGFIRSVRAISDVYIIVLTARTSEDDQVGAYALGADDYVEKPFHCKALVSKIGAVFSRLDRKLYGMAVQQVEGLRLDEASRSVWVEGLARDLKPKEYDLLSYLMLNQGVVLTRERILGQVWGFDYSGGDRTVDVHVSNLRRKLGAHGGRIQTVAGVGYKFEAGVMKYRGLYARLFVISAVFLSALVGGLLLFQMRYFGSIYTAQKETQFFADMQAARAGLDGRTLTQPDLEDYLNGRLRTSGAWSLSVYPVSLPSDPATPDELKKLISAGTVAAPGDATADQLAATLLLDMLSSGALPNQPREETYTLPKQEAQYALFVQTVTIRGEAWVMIGMASLQPVGEAVRLLAEASWLVFGAAVLVSLALSAVIAAAVARPLMREVAHEKALDARRREFIAHASHELKTPISIISSYAESLLDDVVSGSERRGYEQVIFDETQRMAHLVREMLDISRLQDAPVALQRTEVRLAALVEQALQRFARPIEAKHIEVTLESRGMAAILADAAQIELVLDNLVSNAIYHTPSGGRVRIGLAEALGGVRFEIENQGEPIPEALLERIWDSFFRADQAHQREDGRYGLGLSIVRLGVERHGGRAGVRNTASGVLFFFELPAR